MENFKQSIPYCHTDRFSITQTKILSFLLKVVIKRKLENYESISLHLKKILMEQNSSFCKCPSSINLCL